MTEIMTEADWYKLRETARRPATEDDSLDHLDPNDPNNEPLFEAAADARARRRLSALLDQALSEPGNEAAGGITAAVFGRNALINQGRAIMPRLSTHMDQASREAFKTYFDDSSPASYRRITACTRLALARARMDRLETELAEEIDDEARAKLQTRLAGLQVDAVKLEATILPPARRGNKRATDEKGRTVIPEIAQMAETAAYLVSPEFEAVERQVNERMRSDNLRAHIIGRLRAALTRTTAGAVSSPEAVDAAIAPANTRSLAASTTHDQLDAALTELSIETWQRNGLWEHPTVASVLQSDDFRAAVSFATTHALSNPGRPRPTSIQATNGDVVVISAMVEDHWHRTIEFNVVTPSDALLEIADAEGAATVAATHAEAATLHISREILQPYRDSIQQGTLTAAEAAEIKTALGREWARYDKVARVVTEHGPGYRLDGADAMTAYRNLRHLTGPGLDIEAPTYRYVSYLHPNEGILSGAAIDLTMERQQQVANVNSVLFHMSSTMQGAQTLANLAEHKMILADRRYDPMIAACVMRWTAACRDYLADPKEQFEPWHKRMREELAVPSNHTLVSPVMLPRRWAQVPSPVRNRFGAVYLTILQPPAVNDGWLKGLTITDWRERGKAIREHLAERAMRDPAFARILAASVNKVIVTQDVVAGAAVREGIHAAKRMLYSADTEGKRNLDGRDILVMVEGRGLMAGFSLPFGDEAARLKIWTEHLQAKRASNPLFAEQIVDAANMRIVHPDPIIAAGIRYTADGARLYAERAAPTAPTRVIVAREAMLEVAEAPATTVLRYDAAAQRVMPMPARQQQDVGPVLARLSRTHKRTLGRKLKQITTTFVELTVQPDGSVLLHPHTPVIAPQAVTAPTVAPARPVAIQPPPARTAPRQPRVRLAQHAL